MFLQIIKFNWNIKHARYASLGAALVLVSLIGCKDSSSEVQSEINTMVSKHAKLKCNLSAMEGSLENTWTDMNVLLAQELPKDMPIDEKNNMLAVKNGSLIRMFESFEGLNDTIKKALNRVENEDLKMVTKIHEVKNMLSKLEDERMTLFAKIQNTHPEELEKWRNLYQELLSRPCK